MGTLILNVLIQYGAIGFICAAFVDLSIRLTRSSEPFTLMEILGTIIAWPIVAGAFLTSVFEDFFN
jgi:hypothetical protein